MWVPPFFSDKSIDLMAGSFPEKRPSTTLPRTETTRPNEGAGFGDIDWFIEEMDSSGVAGADNELPTPCQDRLKTVLRFITIADESADIARV